MQDGKLLHEAMNNTMNKYGLVFSPLAHGALPRFLFANWPAPTQKEIMDVLYNFEQQHEKMETIFVNWDLRTAQHTSASFQ